MLPPQKKSKVSIPRTSQSQVLCQSIGITIALRETAFSQRTIGGEMDSNKLMRFIGKREREIACASNRSKFPRGRTA
jgi:hypothetical protein